MRFISIPSRYENASYGCGSITDGTFKITVNISNFIPNDNMKKGDAVRIIGIVNTENSKYTFEFFHILIILAIINFIDYSLN